MSKQESFWNYFWLPRFLMRIGGILPIGGTLAQWKLVLAEILAAAPLFYGSYVAIPWINFIIYQSPAMDDLLEAVVITIIVMSGQCRSVFVLVHRHKIARLFAACEALWNHTDAQDFKVISTWARRAKLCSTAYFCAAQLAITTFVLSATAKQLSSPANSTIRYYPFRFQDSTPSPQYEIRYISQAMIGYIGASTIAAVDTTGILLVLNMCGHLALIQNWLSDLSSTGLTTTDEISDEDLELTLKKCIRRQQIVFHLCTELEEVVCYINLTQIMVGMYIMAISCARLMATHLKSTQFGGMLMLSISGHLFSCWPADNLSYMSSDVSQVVYGFPWYRSSPRVKTAVFIMLMRSQRPIQLTAGKFMVLSLETFSSILSSGMSFCMVLNSF